MKKRLVIIALLLAMVMLLFACGKEETKPTASDSNTVSPSESKTEEKLTGDEAKTTSSENMTAQPVKNDSSQSGALEGTWTVTDIVPGPGSMLEGDKEQFESGILAWTFTFQGGEMITVRTYNWGSGAPDVDTNNSPYHVEGNRIIADNESFKFEISGNTLKLFAYGDTVILKK